MRRLLAATLILLTLGAGCGLAVAAPQPPRDRAFDALPRPAKTGDGQWNGSLSAGFSLSRGNNNATQFSFTGDAARPEPTHRWVGNAVVVRETNAGKRTADNGLVNGRYERNLGPDWFGYGNIRFERDAFRDVTLRQSYGVGLGNRVVQHEGTELSLFAGLAYAFENNRVADNAHGLELMLGNEFSHAFSRDVSLTQRSVVVPRGIGDSGLRAVFQAGLNTRLIGPFGVQISGLLKYKENVPEGVRKTDLVVFTGVSARF